MGKSESYHMQVYMRPEVRERLAALSKKLGLSQSATVVLALDRLEENTKPRKRRIRSAYTAHSGNSVGGSWVEKDN